MIAGVPLLPAILLDIIGSAANIVLAFLSWRYALLLSRRQPDNFVWGYLFYVTFAIAAFTISRAVGHLIKQFLLIAARPIYGERFHRTPAVSHAVHDLGGGGDDLLSQRGPGLRGP